MPMIDFRDVARAFPGGVEASDIYVGPTLAWSATAPAALILDTFPAMGAWSLRNLSSTTDKVVRVRRDSDNAQSDFTAAEIVGGALASWVGSGDGFVSVLYDQTPNARNPAQSTFSAQPRLVSSGSVIFENGKPAMDFDGDRYLTLGLGNSLNYSGGFLNVFSVNGNTRSGVTDRLVADDKVGAQGYFLLRPKFSLAITINDGNGYKSGGSPLNYTAQTLLTFLFNGSTGGGEYFLKGASQGAFTLSPWSAGIGASGQAGFAIGSGADGGQGWVGTQQELIIYNTDQAANRAAIEADLAAYHGITLS